MTASQLRSAHQKELHSKLWKMANELRGSMEANEFKNYILGMIFYRYLSDKVRKFVDRNLENDGVTFQEAWDNKDMRAGLTDDMIGDFGYVIKPEFMFGRMVEAVEAKSFDIEQLHKAINSIVDSTLGQESEEAFEGLFDDMDLTSTKLGRNVPARSALMAKIIAAIDEIDFDHEETEIDVLGDAYEYLIGQFAANAGKKAGEYFTEPMASQLLARLATIGISDIVAAADPTCGSGSLLLRLNKYANVRTYWGQELTATTARLSRMSCILHGIDYKNFHIYNDDTLEHDRFEERKFQVQVANPPYSAKWSADQKFEQDDRFAGYGNLAPKSKADWAFVQHMIHHMDEDGRIAVLLPHGVLFRGNSEGMIRRHIIEKFNYLDAVIGLPANLFFGTSIPVCVLVLKKNREENKDDVLFIDASKYFEPGKNQNRLRDEDLDRIVAAYQDRKDIDKFAHVATMEEIAENDYNLNIPRYVDTFEPEPEVDLDAEFKAISDTQKKIEEIDEDLKKYFEELGLPTEVLS